MATWRARVLRLAHVAVPAALAITIGALVAVMYASRRDGHWWGDDWALYLRQAQSLLDGDPGRVASENQFTIDASRGPAFSPPLYPWGFPALLAPFVAVVGADVDALAIVPVLSAAVFASCWFAIVRRRLGDLAALLSVPAIVLSPLLLGWTELIQSEWSFLAVTSGVLVGLDRIVADGRLLAPAAALLPLALLGVGIAASFSVRREGLGLVAAVAGAQLVVLTSVEGRGMWQPGHRQQLAVRALLPHGVALAVVALIQIALPSTLVPSYDGTSVANVWRLAGDHIDHLAEVVGLKRPWDRETIVLGSSVLGWIVVLGFLVASVAGLLLATTRHRARDAHLAVYAITAFVIGTSFRVAVNRYVCSVAPILLLLALVAVRSLARGSEHRVGRAVGGVVTALVLSLLVAGNVANAHVRIDRARSFAAANAVEWGPTHPDAIEMFTAVEELSAADGIIAAPKARAMVLETGRPAVQVDDDRPIPDQVDLALVVVETSSDLYRSLQRGSVGDFELVWSNPRFAIFQPSSAASASTNGAGSSSTASP